MTPSDSQALTELTTAVVRIEGQIEANTRARAEDSRHQAEALAAIKTQVERTNGRVNALESWKDRLLGAGAAVSIIYAVATELFGLLAK